MYVLLRVIREFQSSVSQELNISKMQTRFYNNPEIFALWSVPHKFSLSGVLLKRIKTWSVPRIDDMTSSINMVELRELQ